MGIQGSKLRQLCNTSPVTLHLSPVHVTEPNAIVINFSFNRSELVLHVYVYIVLDKIMLPHPDHFVCVLYVWLMMPLCGRLEFVQITSWGTTVVNSNSISISMSFTAFPIYLYRLLT